MYQKTEVVKETSKLVLNYHKHHETGGVGHVSMELTHEGKVVKLSVYPTEDLSPTTPIVVTSMYVFPSKAVNHTEPYESDCPIHSSYDITSHIKDMDAVRDEMVRLHNQLESGNAAFSLTPSRPIQVTAALLHPKSSTSNMLTGLRMMDREIIQAELDQVEILNCAESISKVLEAGGMQRPEGILNFATPSGINSHFASLTKTVEQVESEAPMEPVKQSQEIPLTSPVQEQPVTQPLLAHSFASPQEEPVSFFRSAYNSVWNYLSSARQGSSSSDSSVENSNSELSVENSNNDSRNDTPSSYSSSSSDEPSSTPDSLRTEESVETNSREVDSSSPRASECSDSFFAQNNDDSTPSDSPSSVASKGSDESDLDFCSRYDAMVN